MLTSQALKDKYFSPADHPYRKYEDKIASQLGDSSTLLDAGCGRSAPVLSKFQGKARRLIGVDLEPPAEIAPSIHYIQGNISAIDLPSGTVDLVISRAVLEHVREPDAVFREISRILKPGGSFITLAPNRYDYVAIASTIIPNRFHKGIVHKIEGRKMEDVFPAYYRANSHRAIRGLAARHGLSIASFEWLGQYPSSLMFNPYLFLLGTAYEKLISRFDFLKYLRGWLLIHLIKPEPSARASGA
ncbi:MAG: class I SAM-dependent methyltransferase [Chromatiaceae bacterium]|nr:class I SAM-dependent methyltransferase [Chromatiaceae bacterium]